MMWECTKCRFAQSALSICKTRECKAFTGGRYIYAGVSHSFMTTVLFTSLPDTRTGDD